MSLGPEMAQKLRRAGKLPLTLLQLVRRYFYV